jgi:poly-gamma-glutamate capsule biosynthesis protein CapA/YwtB (metallophosphatase superfamily)
MRRAMKLFGITSCAMILALAALGSLAQAQDEPTKPSNEPGDYLKQPAKPASVTGSFSLVSIGDLLYSHPMAARNDPELQKVITLIRSGDVTIANREGITLAPDTRAASYGTGLLWAEGSLAADEKAMGIDMVSLANNHGMDWGEKGLFDTIRLHEQAGIVTAGGGSDWQKALAAGVLTTAKGRIALVSTASTFGPNARANDAWGKTAARPGISTLRTQTVQLVNPAQFARIRSLATELASPLRPAPAPDAKEIDFNDQIYRLSDRTALLYEMDLYDHAALLRSIREAKGKADLVVFTIHAHESATGMDDDTPPPPNFLITLFHNAVDAGADVIMGGGPHSLRGVEIYKGKPILYGLGAFFINGEIEASQEMSLQVFPDASGHAPPPRPPEKSVRAGGNPASWYDGVVAITDYEGGIAKRLRLYPLDLGNTYDRSRRGIPHFASPDNARRILADLQKDSAQFGTRIRVEGSVGVVDIR